MARRRKEARPGEIVAAALAVFAERGFAGAKMDDIADLAGLSKAALYLYFPSKEEVFRAVVRQAVAPNVEALRETLLAAAAPFPALVATLLDRLAHLATVLPIGAVAKMVIGESRNFPELARVWHDDVVEKGVGLLSSLIEQRQSRGELRGGDSRMHAFSIIGPMLIGVIWRETFTPLGGGDVDLGALARQHGETIARGLLNEESRP
jgi:AcrR family transcriptional regulator